jgi:hypothetical protein
MPSSLDEAERIAPSQVVAILSEWVRTETEVAEGVLEVVLL